MMSMVSIYVSAGAHSCEPSRVLMGKGSFIDAWHSQGVTELTRQTARGQAWPSSRILRAIGRSPSCIPTCVAYIRGAV